MTQYIRLVLDLSFCGIAILLFSLWTNLNSKYRKVKEELKAEKEDKTRLVERFGKLTEEKNKLYSQIPSYSISHDIPKEQNRPHLSVLFVHNYPGALKNHAELPPRVFVQLSKAEEYPYWCEYAPLAGRDNLGQFERLRLEQLEEENKELRFQVTIAENHEILK